MLGFGLYVLRTVLVPLVLALALKYLLQPVRASSVRGRPSVVTFILQQEVLDDRKDGRGNACFHARVEFVGECQGRREAEDGGAADLRTSG